MKDHSIKVPVRGDKITVTLDKIIESDNYLVEQEFVPSVVIDCLYAIKLLALEIKDLKKEIVELKEIIIGDQK